MSVGPGGDPTSAAHESTRFARRDQERFYLGIERGIQLLERDIHGRLEELSGFRTSVADEDIELAEMLAGFGEHVLDLLHLADVRLQE